MGRVVNKWPPTATRVKNPAYRWTFAEFAELTTAAGVIPLCMRPEKFGNHLWVVLTDAHMIGCLLCLMTIRLETQRREVCEAIMRLRQGLRDLQRMWTPPSCY